MTRRGLTAVIVVCVTLLALSYSFYASAQYEITATERAGLNSLGRAQGCPALGDALYWATRGVFEDGVIGTDELADDAVTTAKILDATLVAADLAANCADTDEIAADAVTAAEIVAGAVGTSEVDDNTLTADDLGTDSVAADEIAADAVTAAEIATDAVGTAEVDNGVVAFVDIGPDAVTEQQMLWNTVFPLQAPGTWGHDAGSARAAGILLGDLSFEAVGFAYGDDGTVFTDYTAAANNAAVNDCIFYATAGEAADDAWYIGDLELFTGVRTQISTAYVAGGGGITTVLEYYNGAWIALPAAVHEDATISLLSVAAATYVTTFVPPADWATVAVNGQVAYWVRWRCDTFTGHGTSPAGQQVWLLQPTHGTGIPVPFDCAVTAVTWSADVLSATNDDTDLLLVNVTTGLYEQVTITQAAYCGTDVLAAPLAVTAADQLVVLMVVEDGTTEFADVTLSLHCRVGG